MKLRSNTPRATSRLCLGLVLVTCLACGGQEVVDTPAPVLVIGVDGLEWSVLLPLLDNGELPTFSRWIESGQAGLLESMRPTKSPVIWTTIATGKRPAEHGIRDFIERNEQGRPRLYTRLDRRVPALWNIASAAGRDSAVIGWWMTHPVEAIRGMMVAQTNVLPGAGGEGDGVWKGAPNLEMSDQVHPPDLMATLVEVLTEADRELDRRLNGIFGELDFSGAPQMERMWQASRWSVRADAVYVELLNRMLEGPEADALDLALVYLGGADVLGHRFWRFHEPAAFDHPPTPEEVARFGAVLTNYYRFLDTVLASIEERTQGRWNVLLISDHGMRPHHVDSRFDDEEPLGRLTSGHHFQAPPGVIVAIGPDIRPHGGRTAAKGTELSDLPALGGVYDITPTVLALLGLPTAADMKGQPMRQLFRGELASRDSLPQVASYTSEPAGDGAPADESADDESERLEQLRDLGYID